MRIHSWGRQHDDLSSLSIISIFHSPFRKIKFIYSIFPFFLHLFFHEKETNKTNGEGGIFMGFDSDTCQDAVLDWIIHMARKQGQCVGVSLAGQRLLDQQANAGATQ